MADSGKVWGPTQDSRSTHPIYDWTTPEKVIHDFHLNMTPDQYRSIYNSGVDPFATSREGIPGYSADKPISMADPALGRELAFADTMPGAAEPSSLTGPAAARQLASIASEAPRTPSGVPQGGYERMAPGGGMLGPTIGKGLRPNSSSTREWQQFLSDQGLYSGPIDGKFGPDTTLGTRLFQRTMGINPDGQVGNQTRYAQAQYLSLPGLQYGPDGKVTQVPGVPMPGAPDTSPSTIQGLPADEWRRQAARLADTQPTIGMPLGTNPNRIALTPDQLAKIGGNPDPIPHVDVSRAINAADTGIPDIVTAIPRPGSPEAAQEATQANLGKAIDTLGSLIPGLTGAVAPTAPSPPSPKAPSVPDVTTPGWTGSYYNPRPMGWPAAEPAAPDVSAETKGGTATAAARPAAADILTSIAAGTPAASAPAGSNLSSLTPAASAARDSSLGINRPAVPALGADTTPQSMADRFTNAFGGFNTPSAYSGFYGGAPSSKAEGTAGSFASGMSPTRSFDAGAFGATPSSQSGNLGAVLAGAAGGDTGAAGGGGAAGDFGSSLGAALNAFSADPLSSAYGGPGNFAGPMGDFTSQDQTM
jgi:hypothetical protein